jgi:hypothetical protein
MAALLKFYLLLYLPSFYKHFVAFCWELSPDSDNVVYFKETEEGMTGGIFLKPKENQKDYK